MAPYVDLASAPASAASAPPGERPSGEIPAGAGPSRRPEPGAAGDMAAEERVRTRLVLHFPGFEPLDAAAHRGRYLRAARQSATVYGLEIEAGPLEPAHGLSAFDVTCRQAGQAGQAVTRSRIVLLDHSALVAKLTRGPLPLRLLKGTASGAGVVLEGGLAGYLRHGWRFALFFLFPFLLLGAMLSLSGLLALLPLALGLDAPVLLLSLPAGLFLFLRLLLPLAERFHALLLLADWEMALAVARRDRPLVNAWLEACIAAARAAIRQADTAEEILISGHSMGASIAAHVLGTLIAREPALLAGRRIVFATLGSAILQCALMRSAHSLRADVGRIARHPGLRWVDVQCLTDPIHFYKAPVVALCGHADAPPAGIVLLRLKETLTAARYRRIRLSFLRVHRQYVLGTDRRSRYDFTLMTAGPAPAARLLDHKRPA